MSSREENNKKLFSEDYEEDENGATSETVCYYSKNTFRMANGREHKIVSRVNVDDNYGFDSNFIKVIVNLKKYDGESSEKRNRIIFPRIVYLNKNWSTRTAHFYIFKYFAYLLKAHHKIEEKEIPDDDLWLKFFNNYQADSSTDYVECQRKNNWPYRLRIKNFNNNPNSYRSERCFFCNNEDCTDCLLPYDDSIKIGDLIERIPKNEDLEIDNNYLFMNRNRGHIINNRDFTLETTWLPEYSDTVHALNDKRDYDFKVMRTAKPKSVSIYDCLRNFVKF
jgi:hypothetical protein